MHDTHGGNVHALTRRRGPDALPILDLSTNTFVACADLAKAIIATTPDAFLQYPDPDYLLLRETIARHEHALASQVLPGNGAAELIWLCMIALRPRHVLMIGPIFSEYTRACSQLGIASTVLSPSAEQGFVPQKNELEAVRKSPADMLIVCLPNNPAGVVYPNMSALGAAWGDRTVLLDVSYREFLHGTEGGEASAWTQLVSSFEGTLIALHSLTKFFCCPGVRLGYALADEASIAQLRAYQAPWMVGGSAAQIGISMLEQIDAFRARLPLLAAQQAAMRAALCETGVFDQKRLFTGPSFITAQLQAQFSTDHLCAALAQQGVLVRNCDTIPGMPAGYVRMQVRDESTLAPLYAGLRSLGK